MTGKEVFRIPDLEKIFQAMQETGTTSLELHDGSYSMVIRRVGLHSHTFAPKQSSPKEIVPSYEDETKYLQIKAPFAGVLYRGTEPGKEPYYVNEGDFVEGGQTIAMIEAMKLMSVIEAPKSGKLIKIFCQDGVVVERDNVLMILDFTQIPDQRS